MKKLLLLLTLFTGLVSAVSAQVCTPDTSHFTAGAFAYPSSLPCITQSSTYSGTISIRIPDSVDAHLFDSTYPAGFYYVHIDSIALDSIVGLPSGISTTINPGSNVFLYPGQFGCVQVSGSTSAAIGNYTLGVAGHGCFHVQLTHHVADSCISGLLPAYFTYTLSVCAPSTVCTPDTSAFTAGVYVYPPNLPCILQGHPYSGTVSIRIPDSVDAHLFVSAVPANTYYLHIDSMRIDSITGAPAGINVTTHPGDSVWLHGGQFGCAVFSGTTNVAPGNFPIGIYGRGCVHGMVFTFNIDSCVSGSLSSYFNYSLNVCNGSGACTVDSAAFVGGARVYPASLPCIVTGVPFTGQVNIQVPDSLDGSDFISQLPPNLVKVYVDSIEINTISGYPAGITSVSNPVLTTWLPRSSFACAVFSGTVNGNVTAAGTYNLTISGIGCGHGTFPVIGYKDTCMATTFTREFPYALNVCYPAGITEVTEGINLNIYPNPNQGNFTVSIASSTRVNGTMSVLDQLGRVIMTQNLDVMGAKQIPLDLGNVSAGAYLLIINTGDNRSVKQFIVR